MFCIAASVPFVLEILQYMEIIPGTFDIIDICVYVLTLTIFILCLRKNNCSISGYLFIYNIRFIKCIFQPNDIFFNV